MKMAFNTNIAYLMICLVTIKSVESQVESDIIAYHCTETADTIVLGGPVHYEMTQLYNMSGEQVQVTHFVTYSVQDHTFYSPNMKYIFGSRYVGGFHIYGCDDELHTNEDKDDCEYIKNLRKINSLSENELLTIRFFLEFDENTRITDRFVAVKGFDDLKINENLVSDLWPPQWLDMSRYDVGILGACAYEKAHRMLIYVINGRNDSEDITVFYRTIKDIREKKDWSSKVIPNTGGKKFIALFYWFLTGKVLASVIPYSRAHRSLAQIYELNLNDEMIITLKSNNSKEFLWKCQKQVEESDDFLIILLLVVTCIVLTLTILMVFYFIYFLIIRKEEDPIFGLIVK